MPSDLQANTPGTIDLATITASPLEAVPRDADLQTLEESKSAQEQYEERKHQLELDAIEQDMRERKDYAFRIFCLVSGWVSAIFLLMLFSGIGFHFHLSDDVLLAAIGSTTANILGVFYIVVRYLFPKR